MYDPAPRSPAPVLFEVEQERERESVRESGAPPQAWRSGPGLDDAAPPAGEKQAANTLARPDDIRELTPELATRRSAATSYGDLAAIIRLQSTEIERLALENDRIAARLGDVHRRHDDERDRRRGLEQQVLHLSARAEPPAPVVDVEEMRRAARESMSAEIKPALMAILDLLETALPRNAGTPAEVPAEVPAEASAETSSAPPPPTRHDSPVVEDFLRLPDILTRPLEELTTREIAPGPKPFRAIEQHLAEAPGTMHVQHPIPPQATPRVPPRAAPRATLPGMFAWTNLFS